MSRNTLVIETRPPECANCPLLDKTIENGCPDDTDEPVIPGRIRMIFPRGARLFEEGASIGGIYCVHSGQVALARERGKEIRTIAVVTAPDILGMPDILGEKTHRNMALALQNTSVCFIPKEEALKLFERDPAVMLRVMQVVCRRIRSIEEQAGK